jgi:hypothetical protein
VINLETTLYLNFTTSSPTTGAPADADSLPSVYVYEDDNDTPILTPTPVNRSVGEYLVAVAATTANGFEVDKTYNVVATGSVGGVDGKIVLATFVVTEPELLAPDGVEDGWSLQEAMRIVLAALGGQLSGAPSGPILIRDVNDTKTRVNATVDSSGNRTSVTLDPT